MARKTVRKHIVQPIAQVVLSSFLWYGLQKLRLNRNRPISEMKDYLKSFGSAFDIFLILYSVEGFSTGVYYYQVENHCLIFMEERKTVKQEMIDIMHKIIGMRTTAWTVVLTADFAQYQWRYRHERALRHLYMEAGRIAQIALLTGMSYYLGTIVSPAIQDVKMSALLQLDLTRQAPIYTLNMGLHRRYQDCL